MCYFYGEYIVSPKKVGDLLEAGIYAKNDDETPVTNTVYLKGYNPATSKWLTFASTIPNSSGWAGMPMITLTNEHVGTWRMSWDIPDLSCGTQSGVPDLVVSQVATAMYLTSDKTSIQVGDAVTFSGSYKSNATIQIMDVTDLIDTKITETTCNAQGEFKVIANLTLPAGRREIKGKSFDLFPDQSNSVFIDVHEQLQKYNFYIKVVQGYGTVYVYKNGVQIGYVSAGGGQQVFVYEVGDAFKFDAIPPSGYTFEKFCSTGTSDCWTYNPWEGNVSATISMEWYFKCVATISIPSTISVVINNSGLITATCGTGITCPTLTWTKSNNNVDISPWGNNIDCTITGVSVGTSIVTATCDGKTSNNCTVTVTESGGTLSQIIITNAISIVKGNTGSVNVTCKDTLGYNMTCPALTWTSSNTSIATVSNGMITGISVGTCTVNATGGGKTSNNCTVTITEGGTGTPPTGTPPPPCSSIAVDNWKPAKTTAAIGENIPFTLRSASSNQAFRIYNETTNKDIVSGNTDGQGCYTGNIPAQPAGTHKIYECYPDITGILCDKRNPYTITWAGGTGTPPPSCSDIAVDNWKPSKTTAFLGEKIPFKLRSAEPNKDFSIVRQDLLLLTAIVTGKTDPQGCYSGEIPAQTEGTYTISMCIYWGIICSSINPYTITWGESRGNYNVCDNGICKNTPCIAGICNNQCPTPGEPCTMPTNYLKCDTTNDNCYSVPCETSICADECPVANDTCDPTISCVTCGDVGGDLYIDSATPSDTFANPGDTVTITVTARNTSNIFDHGIYLCLIDKQGSQSQKSERILLRYIVMWGPFVGKNVKIYRFYYTMGNSDATLAVSLIEEQANKCEATKVVKIYLDTGQDRYLKCVNKTCEEKEGTGTDNCSPAGDPCDVGNGNGDCWIPIPGGCLLTAKTGKTIVMVGAVGLGAFLGLQLLISLVKK